jgi:uncharacterized protein
VKRPAGSTARARRDAASPGRAASACASASASAVEASIAAPFKRTGDPANVVVHRIARALRLGLLLALLPAAAHALDCRHPTGRIVPLLCANADLQRTDHALNLRYRAALAQVADPAALKAAQRQWIDDVQSACTSATCLQQAYDARNAQLDAARAPWCERQRGLLAGDWQRSGDDGFYETFSLGADGAFDSWLHDRPEVAGGHWRLAGCTLELGDPATATPVRWLLLELDGHRLTALDRDDGSEARYRRDSRH